MNRFFLMTRGRTGSTAIIDELGKNNEICTTQELFLKYNFGDKKSFGELYNFIPPFDVWKTDTKLRKLLPTFIYSDSARASAYLQEAESISRRRGGKSFAFKLLSHQFDERPYLSSLLRNREYQTIYLTRNLARQVLSGMVAAQRGYYNLQKDIEDNRQYEIDLEKFQRLVGGEKQAIEVDYTRLMTNGFSFIVVTYEEYILDRKSFYEKIFQFLGLPMELPAPSNWKVMIKDLKQTIANFDEVAERAVMIGYPLNS